MSRARNRARRRCARTEQLSRDFQINRQHPEALAQMLEGMARADLPIWPLARLVDLTDEEWLLVVHYAAPHLSGGAGGRRLEKRKQLEAAEERAREALEECKEQHRPPEDPKTNPDARQAG